MTYEHSVQDHANAVQRVAFDGEEGQAILTSENPQAYYS